MIFQVPRDEYKFRQLKPRYIRLKNHSNNNDSHAIIVEPDFPVYEIKTNNRSHKHKLEVNKVKDVRYYLQLLFRNN